MRKQYSGRLSKPYTPTSVHTTRITGQGWQRVRDSSLLDISHWRTVCDVTLTLKQGRKANDGRWVHIDEYECRRAFRHFMNLLDRAVFGKTQDRHNKRLKVIPVLEKSGLPAGSAGHSLSAFLLDGRWHIHCAVELPDHVDAIQFELLVDECWAKVDWAHKRTWVRDKADRGWIDYMLKLSQKSVFDSWYDCIDWENLHNSIAGA